VREAGCYAADRDLLLGAIESGYSTLDHFNEEMRKVLAAALHTAHSRSWEGSSSTPSLSLKASKAAKLRWQGVMQMAWRDLEMTEQNGKTSQGDAANSVPTFATVTAQASSRSRTMRAPRMMRAPRTTLPRQILRSEMPPCLMGSRTPPSRERQCAVSARTAGGEFLFVCVSRVPE
jgi:hypothetical protein